LTNAHVVRNCVSIRIGPEQSVRLVAYDNSADLALLQAPAMSSTKPAKFTRGAVRLGSEIAIFGFPLRGILADQLNMTTGIVSSLAGIGGDATAFQISAAVQPGNSGGPAVDMTGGVIGVVSGTLNRVRGASAADDATPQLVNFAVRKEYVVRFLRDSGIEPDFAPVTSMLTKTELADQASKYTVAISCTRI
jgi:serine protease Do